MMAESLFGIFKNGSFGLDSVTTGASGVCIRHLASASVLIFCFFRSMTPAG